VLACQDGVRIQSEIPVIPCLETGSGFKVVGPNTWPKFTPGCQVWGEYLQDRYLELAFMESTVLGLNIRCLNFMPGVQS
jgi:hypothetical protein